VIYPPKVRVSELVNALKGVSSRRLEVEFPAIPIFWSVRKSQGALWSPSYLVGSVGGAPIEILRQYIENQGRSERPA
jgi:putative transposase